MKKLFKEIEKKWILKWQTSNIYTAVDFDSKEKKYILVEFPYPSGSGLHIGHAFSFTGGDVYARYMRMKGNNVLFPMGWDAFGLPTENYAIKVKRKPQDITEESTKMFRELMDKLAFSFDWSREINTTDPEYYKWTQWIFLKLFEKGLAYKEERPINWCPSCKIGLANEEVVDGNCERCGAETTKRNISQWIVKITDYADKLIDGLEKTQFIEKVKAAQINWIDKKDWIDITYEIKGLGEKITVSTTRPDTNFGATFVVLAPEHELVQKILAGEVKVVEDVNVIKEYVKSSLRKSELERQKDVLGRKKTGAFTGLYALNPFNGKEMPVWIADFVLSSVGTGAVVGVPGHDVRDFEFAQQFNLPVIRVVEGKDGEKGEIDSVEKVYEGEGVAMASEFLNGLDTPNAIKEMMEYIEEKNLGKKTTRYHLRDWIFSRQHYWGEPIPMISCAKCGWVSVPEEDLPVLLPEVENYEPTDTGESPLAKMLEWVNVVCPKCGGPGKRETDTMPNWAGSDWYFIRYADPKNNQAIADFEKMKYWLPVDVYIGGDEHNTLHLLYSRFIYQFLHDLKIVPTSEPYFKRLSHGVILGPDNQRMSKSRGNVVVPDDIANKVGADATRTYLMFMGPFDSTMAWNESSLLGVKRFFERIYSFVSGNLKDFSDKDSDEVFKKRNQTIKSITEALEKFHFNTPVAKLMEFLNFLETVEKKDISKKTVEDFLKLLAPYMPFLTEELWEKIGGSYSIHNQEWPAFDEASLIENTIELPIQINGKVRGKINISSNIGEEELKKEILENEIFKKHIVGEVRKFIYVKGKIANIVCN
jgi:leucyl-tRNA synthetase